MLLLILYSSVIISYQNILSFMSKWVISFQFSMEAVLLISKKYKSQLKVDFNFLLQLQDTWTITGTITKDKGKWMFFLVLLLILTVLKYGIKNLQSHIIQVNNFRNFKIQNGHLMHLKSLKISIKFKVLLKLVASKYMKEIYQK